MTVLLHAEQTLTGRTLHQDGDRLWVGSGCCDSVMSNTYAMGVPMVKCDYCHARLARNEEGWSTRVDLTELDTDEVWQDWAKYWFGFEQMVMDVDW